jgi:hypothetical protein
MIEGHIDHESLKAKILTLFEYRLFPNLLDLIETNDRGFQKEDFLQQLIELQTSIYHLDAHLEAHWETNSGVLLWHWVQINQHLMTFGIGEEDVSQYNNHIKIYERHELGLRQNKDLLRLNHEYFYFYKSCDVKLLRRLIYERGLLNGVAGKLSDWRYYDLITELNDDVEDIFEDLDFINGNMVLLYVLRHGKDKAFEVFDAFMADIQSKATAQHGRKKQHSFKQYIYDTTILRLEETRTLLTAQLAKLTLKDLKQSKLYLAKKELAQVL